MGYSLYILLMDAVFLYFISYICFHIIKRFTACMKLRFLYLGLLPLAALSCSVNEISNPEPTDHSEFYATIDEQPGADTKVYADENLRILWNHDDRISIFNKNTYNRQFYFYDKDGSNAGSIKKVDGDSSPDGDPLSKVYAVYPYQELTQISGDGGVITTSMPSEQTYLAKSFGRGANMMVSATDDNKLRFKNVGGYLSLKFFGAGVSVSSINLRSNNGEPLSGACSISTTGSVPELTMSDGAGDEVTLVCESPVALGATAAEAVQFIFVLPPQTLSGGFTVRVTTPEGAVFEKSSTSPRVIGRSSITPLGAMEVVPELPGNIVFADPEVKAICVKYWDTDEDGGLSYGEAAAVETLMVEEALTRASGEVSAFAGTGITTFDELVYFTGLKSIEEGAFEGCTGLKSVTISEQVGEIGANAFNGCQNLESITLTSPAPPEIGEGAFANTNDCPIYVPEEAVETYLGSNGWSLYSERITGVILPENFPDETFRSYVFSNFDTDKDGLLSEAECDAIRIIEVNTDNISSLEGIAYFKNLWLLSCKPEGNVYERGGALTSLDVSNNAKLGLLICSGNQLSSIDVSKNSALTNLVCDYNRLTSLDVSNNAKLSQLEINNNQFTSLDVSNNTSLSSLDCNGNSITSLDLSSNPRLMVLECSYNQLTNLDVSNNPALTTLECDDNQLTSLDISNLSALKRLSCNYNELSDLDISNNLSLTALVCFENQFSCLDVSKNVNLTFLNCEDNQLTNLDVSNNVLLETLYCSNPTMQYLYFSEGQEIVNLYKHSNTTIVYIPEAIDLGLSVKWASFNLGAANSQEVGNYYAWGETNVKDDYSWETYKWCDGSAGSINKYLTHSEGGYDLKPEDDVATVCLGEGWRIPTKLEREELYNNCTITREFMDGGLTMYKLTSNINGNYIYLPASGFYEGTELGSQMVANFWTSSVHYYSTAMFDNSLADDGFIMPSTVQGCHSRCYGMPIRPVYVD